jgi:hypothetical protein
LVRIRAIVGTPVAALLAVDDFDVEIEPAIEREIRRLRVRARSEHKCCDDGDTHRSHRNPPPTDDIASVAGSGSR